MKLFSKIFKVSDKKQLKILENRLKKKKKKQMKLYEQQKVLRAEITVLLRGIEDLKREEQ